MNRAIICFAVGAALALCSTAAKAQDEEDEDEYGDTDGDAPSRYAAVAVQNRLYGSTHEITAHVGFLPMDAFTKGLTVGGTYTLHLSDLFAWEVVNGIYSIHLDTSLKRDLAAFSLAPTPFEVANFVLTSNLVFKPIYWKGAWLRGSVIHGEIQGIIGGGYAEFTRSQNIAINAGIGLRIFLSTTFAVRLDVRYVGFINTAIFQSFNISHEIWTSLGLSVSL